MRPPGDRSEGEASGQATPLTLWLGVGLILLLEGLLLTDLRLSSRGAVHSMAQLSGIRPPAGAIGRVSRFAAVNMTPLAWPAYVLFLDGLLQTLHRRNVSCPPSAVRRRPHHFALLCLASVFIWCAFDTINFYFIHAWSYIEAAPTTGWLAMADRYRSYLLAFATIVPGMLLSGQVLLNLRLFSWARYSPWHMPAWAVWAVMLGGATMLAWPFLDRRPITNLTLWTGPVFLLDPINFKLGRPSMLRDWQNGWYGRTLAAFAGGLVCGLLWEFWNYFALAKWVYHLPFLGAMEHIKYFEMPLPGLVGFLPFGMGCWIMWQTMRAALDGLAEPLADDGELL